MNGMKCSKYAEREFDSLCRFEVERKQRLGTFSFVLWNCCLLIGCLVRYDYY